MEKTDNELIAEFMGYSFIGTEYDTFWNPPGDPTATIDSWKYHNHHLAFHNDWNWLMPVVEKIADLYEESDHDRHWNKSVDKLRSSILFADIVVVHQAVVDFIRWHNTQNQTK